MNTIIDDEWEAFLNNDVIKPPAVNNKPLTSSDVTPDTILPKCEDLYISTTNDNSENDIKILLDNFKVIFRQ